MRQTIFTIYKATLLHMYIYTTRVYIYTQPVYIYIHNPPSPPQPHTLYPFKNALHNNALATLTFNESTTLSVPTALSRPTQNSHSLLTTILSPSPSLPTTKHTGPSSNLPPTSAATKYLSLRSCCLVTGGTAAKKLHPFSTLARTTLSLRPCSSIGRNSAAPADALSATEDRGAQLRADSETAVTPRKYALLMIAPRLPGSRMSSRRRMKG